MVDVAQLVEPLIVIPVVAGSIPVVHPIKKRLSLVALLAALLAALLVSLLVSLSSAPKK